MQSKEFLEILRNNTDDLFQNFHDIYKLNFKQTIDILERIINNALNDEFFKKMLENQEIDFLFDKNYLLRIKNHLLSFGITEETIKRIIINTPQILLFSNNIDNIHLLFKNNFYKGYVLTHNNDYKSYGFFNSLSIDDYDITNCDYIIRDMFNSLERNDIKTINNFNEKPKIQLDDKINALTKENSKKNFYFKTPTIKH